MNFQQMLQDLMFSPHEGVGHRLSAQTVTFSSICHSKKKTVLSQSHTGSHRYIYLQHDSAKLPLCLIKTTQKPLQTALKSASVVSETAHNRGRCQTHEEFIKHIYIFIYYLFIYKYISLCIRVGGQPTSWPRISFVAHNFKIRYLSFMLALGPRHQLVAFLGWFCIIKHLARWESQSVSYQML